MRMLVKCLFYLYLQYFQSVLRLLQGLSRLFRDVNLFLVIALKLKDYKIVQCISKIYFHSNKETVHHFNLYIIITDKVKTKSTT